jgi:hypothetical protein
MPLYYSRNVDAQFQGRNYRAKDYIGIEAGIAFTEAIASSLERRLGIEDADKTVTDD